MSTLHRIKSALFLLRLGVFIVMAMWSIDKIVNAGHAAAVFEKFYLIEGMGTEILMAIGIAQLLLEIAFLLGLWKFWTYGYVLVFHSISTLSSWNQYLDPFNNMLFLAALPMLAACITLFMLRDQDTLLTLGKP